MKFNRRLGIGTATAITTLGAVAFGASATALAHPDSSTGAWSHMWDGTWGGHMGNWGGHAGSWMGVGGWTWLMGLVWALALVAVPAALAFLLLRRNRPARGDPALAQLRERYARGELSDEEYERRRNRLLHP